jgi:hypothetical protein
MGLKVLQPQEVEVFYILPAIRKAFAAALKAKGLTQAKIADILGVSGAAVSQYFSDKRGSDVTFEPATAQHIAEAASRIKDQANFVHECQQILNEVTSSKAICGIHKQLGDVPQNCTICFDGKVHT